MSKRYFSPQRWCRADRYRLRVASRPFRFGLQIAGASSLKSLVDKARRAEDLGFDTIVIGDHIVDGSLAPMTALAAMAAATSTLRVGTLVLNNDFRHPTLLAREAATLDLVTDGRFELGLGAGHAAPEYEEIGMEFAPSDRRVGRLEESVLVLRRLFAGETVSFAGDHYQIDHHALYPARRPTLLVGGNGKRVLQLAAREADVVGFTGLGRTLPDGQLHEPEWNWEQIDNQVALVRAAAGTRVDELEFNVLVQHIAITENRLEAVAPIAARTGADPDVLVHAPYLLVGSVGQIAEQLQDVRERWGFSYFVTRDANATGPIIESLR